MHLFRVFRIKLRTSGFFSLFICKSGTEKTFLNKKKSKMAPLAKGFQKEVVWSLKNPLRDII